MYVIQGNGWIDLYHRTIIKDWKAPDMWAHYGLRANSAWGNDPMGYHEINLISASARIGSRMSNLSLHKWFYAEEGIFLGTYSLGAGHLMPAGSRL